MCAVSLAMFILFYVTLCLVVSCSAFNPEVLKKLIGEATTVVDKCSTVVTKEWNDAVEKRYQLRKAKLGFSQDECLMAPLMKYDEYGPSGGGSSAAVTKPLRELLRTLFRDPQKNITTFFDAPCGDWVWMQYVDLGHVSYLGGDITSYTIEENKRCFAKHNVEFTLFDLTCNKIPEVDLMLTRDILFHLKPEVGMKILNSIGQSKVKYFLSTTFMSPNAENPYNNHRSYGEVSRGANSTIGYRNINLFDAPFCMPKPLLKVEDLIHEKVPRYVALWKLPFKVGECETVKAKGIEAWKDF